MCAAQPSIFDATSDSESPVNSTTKRDSGLPSMKPVIREYSRFAWACLTIMPPMCSTAVGSSSKAATVASIDSMSS